MCLALSRPSSPIGLAGIRPYSAHVAARVAPISSESGERLRSLKDKGMRVSALTARVAKGLLVGFVLASILSA
jgi:hypothetical protein